MIKNVKLLFTKVYHQFKFTQEHWFTTGKGREVPPCPMCLELEQLGWIPFGILPEKQKAHSTLGGGNWNAPDSACKCVKRNRFVSGNYPEWAKNNNGSYKSLQFDDATKSYLIFNSNEKCLSKEQAIKAIENIKQKYSATQCCNNH